MNRILEIDLANERAVVQPGVVNIEITQAAGGSRPDDDRVIRFAEIDILRRYVRIVRHTGLRSIVLSLRWRLVI